MSDVILNNSHFYSELLCPMVSGIITNSRHGKVGVNIWRVRVSLDMNTFLLGEISGFIFAIYSKLVTMSC